MRGILIDLLRDWWGEKIKLTTTTNNNKKKKKRTEGFPDRKPSDAGKTLSHPRPAPSLRGVFPPASGHTEPLRAKPSHAEPPRATRGHAGPHRTALPVNLSIGFNSIIFIV